jgi:hypothetical protein
VHSYLQERFEVLEGRVGFRLDGMAAARETDARGAPQPLLRPAVVAKEFERELHVELARRRPVG